MYFVNYSYTNRNMLQFEIVKFYVNSICKVYPQMVYFVQKGALTEGISNNNHMLMVYIFVLTYFEQRFVSIYQTAKLS